VTRGRLRIPLVLYVATLATLPLARPAVISVGSTGVQVSDILLALTYVSTAAWWVREGRWPRGGSLLWPGLLFVAVAVASIVLSPEAGVASWLKLLALAAYVLLPWLSQDLLGEDEAGLRWAVRAWIGGTVFAVAVAIAGIVVFMFDQTALTDLGCSYGRLPEGPYPRVCIPFRNPNYLANYLTASFPLLLACGRLLLPRPWHVVAVAGCAVAALSTLSTGIGGFALAAGITIWALQRPRDPAGRPLWARLAPVAAVIAALGAAAVTVGHVVPPGHGDLDIAGHEWSFTRGPRVHTWLSAGRTIAEHPLLGVGYGLTVARTPGRELHPWLTGQVDPLAREGPLFAEAHDAWLNVAGQTGLLGLAAFVLLVVAVARRQGMRPLLVGSSLRHLPAAVVAGLVGGFLFHGLFTGAEEFRHLWAVAGLGAGANALRARLSPGRTPSA
jgi:hypothetical protein